MNKSTKGIVLMGLGLIIISAAVFAWKADAPTEEPAPQQQETPKINNTVSYSCDAKKAIGAGYGDGLVVVKLSDNRQFTLEQTISGSGIRYANEGESVVFWSKGNTAFLQENGATTYENCVDITSQEDPAPDTQGTAPSNPGAGIGGSVGGGAVACTMDAKICPDGSAVGRTGPNCEFAKCPGESN